MSLNKEQHRNRHKTLHLALDELFADFITHGGGRTGQPIMALIEWSHRQTVNPDHEEAGGCGEDPV
jgi:hypothetical protein